MAHWLTIHRDHCISNPNNALLTGKPSKLPYIGIVWSLKNGKFNDPWFIKAHRRTVSPCQHQRITNTSPHPDDCTPQLRTKGYNHPASAHKKKHPGHFFLAAKIFGDKLVLFWYFSAPRKVEGMFLDGTGIFWMAIFWVHGWSSPCRNGKTNQRFLGINILQVWLTILTFWPDLCCFSWTHMKKPLL